MKAFIRSSQSSADRLLEGLERICSTDLRVAVTHYLPVSETLQDERLEIYPFLGSFFLAEAIDRGQANLALHGHAHRGSEQGVRQVAYRSVMLRSLFSEPPFGSTA